MKRILIVSDSIRVGGIQKSLINMLNIINYDNYSIDLLLFDDKNTKNINKNVNILPSSNFLRLIGSTSSEIKKVSKIKYFERKILSLLCLLFGSNFIFSIIYSRIKIDNEYDIAISYSNNVNNKSLYYGYNKFVLEKVKAKEKKCWIHIDYKNRTRNKNEIQEFNMMDEIILVSNACKNNFNKIYPEFKDKTKVVYNVVNIDETIEERKKEQPLIIKKNNFNIISIGRLESNKNIESQIIIANKLKQLNMAFKWYVIGNGTNYKKLNKKIHELKLNNDFILLGEIKNVYPFINKSSLLVSTSLSESFGLTIAEAMSLNVPVMVLRYPAISEIVPNNCIFDNIDEMFNKIVMLLNNKEEYSIYKKNCYYLIDNKMIERQINDVLGGKNGKNC